MAQVLKDRPDAPGNFCLKLRKHIRTRRLEDVRQVPSLGFRICVSGLPASHAAVRTLTHGGELP